MAKKIEKISQFEVSEEREKEPKAKVVVVYRGENPYMMRLSERLKEMGYEVDERRISVEAKEEIDKLTSSLIEPEQKAALIKKIIGEIPQNVCVVTDRTMDYYVSLLDVEPIHAYREALNREFKSPADIVTYYKPVVDELRERGKVPVLVQKSLSDHFYFDAFNGFEESEKNKIIEKAIELGLYPQYLKEIKDKKDFRFTVEREERAVLLSTVVNQDLNVPVITENELYWGFNRDGEFLLQGNVIEILKKHGFNKDQVVLLVDHHVYELRGENLKKSGFPEVPIVPVCSCCMGSLGANLKKRGFNVFDLKFEGSNDMFEKVKQAIEKRILDLKKQKEKIENKENS